ncbi:hypothetical protein HHK36_033396 [Tetracentron sinense]|uniref:PGG domain-containing protein n=1 Tax=Tetracentron sinense TaxID=13715 RepID=A0A834Y3M8_TETSI|nr:hypothetical protein HHK36_033396 [Tetracentron sinense]
MRDKAGGNGVDRNFYVPLYIATLRGDWESARIFLLDHPEALTARITIDLGTLMPADALALPDKWGNTALHNAALAGITRTIKAPVRKNPALPYKLDNGGTTPLGISTLNANLEKKEMVWYLCSVTTKEETFTGASGAAILCDLTMAGFYDIALHLLHRYPHLATDHTRDDHAIGKTTVLHVMAAKPSAFPSGSRLGFFQRFIYSLFPRLYRLLWKAIDKLGMQYYTAAIAVLLLVKLCLVLTWFPFAVPGIKQVRDTKFTHIHSLELVKCILTQIQRMSYSQITTFLLIPNIMEKATTFGTIEIVTACVKCFPDLILFYMKGHRSIFHVAVEHRQEKIFNLIYGGDVRATGIFHYRDELGNTILHLAAKLAPSPQLNSVSGAALQMQRELQWFKEVEKIVRPSYKDWTNRKGKTAKVLLTEEHKDLVKEGEKWMKDTATSCMLVATLVATIVFAAAFTVPGGNDNARGIPIFLKYNSFKVFIVSDALALFSAATSVLMFLSILTSRYAEEDFLKSLPTKLIIGLAFLFFSIATMMIAFSAALSIILSENWAWASLPIALIACFPVTLFALLQLPLFVEIFYSTYGSGIFKKDSKYRLY